MYVLTPEIKCSSELLRKLEMIDELTVSEFSFGNFIKALDEIDVIKHCSVLIVDNFQPLTTDVAQKIILGMKSYRPIILTNSPLFDSHCSAFEKEIILKRTNKTILANLHVLDVPMLADFLTSVISTPYNYSLTQQENKISKFYTNIQLRQLV